jgi:hypothetical protein
MHDIAWQTRLEATLTQVGKMASHIMVATTEGSGVASFMTPPPTHTHTHSSPCSARTRTRRSSIRLWQRSVRNSSMVQAKQGASFSKTNNLALAYPRPSNQPQAIPGAVPDTKGRFDAVLPRESRPLTQLRRRTGNLFQLRRKRPSGESVAAASASVFFFVRGIVKLITGYSSTTPGLSRPSTVTRPAPWSFA